MIRPRHIVLAVAAGIYRVELVHGGVRVSGGVFSGAVELDDLADLILVLDEAGEELRRRARDDVGPGRDGGGR